MTAAKESGARGAHTFGFQGELVEVDLRDGPVLFVVRLDATEHSRRGRAGLGAITDRELITALWELPHEIALAKERFPGWAVKAMRSAPAGVVEHRGDAIARTVRAPLDIVGAVAIGRRLDRLLRRVGQVSAIAPAAVLVDRRIEADEPGLLDARLYGVGVAQDLGGEIARVIDPAPVVPTLGPFWWWVSELAYDALGSGVSRDSPRP